MANTKKTRNAARKGLESYTRALGMTPTLHNPETLATDLIADLLLTFPADVAADILRRAEGHADADRDA